MFKLIRGASVYTPDYAGEKDVLVSFDKIACIGDNLKDTLGYTKLIDEEIDGYGKLLMPGFVDQHVHITGGGGEGGFSTRTPEVEAAELLENGITSVVGVLGTDGVTRGLDNLYAKAKALQEEGVSAYIYTGSYQLPVVTFTGSIQRDLVLIDRVIGVGEIAISDHRSFQPTPEELARIAAQARNGGMISGKAGIVHLHLGDVESGLDIVLKVLEKTGIPAAQFVPTHMNRNSRLLNQALEFARLGGCIDLTAGFEDDDNWPDCIPAPKALKLLLDSGISETLITMSSDGNGSVPAFDSNGNLTGIECGSCKVLMDDVKKGVFDLNLSLETVLKTVTLNPARILKLDGCKGMLAPGKDADLVLTDKNLKVVTVFAKGKMMVRNGKYIA